MKRLFKNIDFGKLLIYAVQGIIILVVLYFVALILGWIFVLELSNII